jgi:hypothetical protein
MSEIKFSCPGCQQKITADAGYAGLQINCPACASPMIVPGPALVAPAAAQLQNPVAPPEPPSASAASGACPSCGNALPRGAVICTRCGYNLATKKRMVAGRVVPPGAPRQKGDAPWYKTAPPYILAVVLVMAGLYLAGRSSPPMMLAFFAIAVLYCLAVHLIVVIAAFRDGAGQGFMTLCLPFYALYYVFKVNGDSTLQMLYGSAVIMNIILRVLPVKD